MSRPGKDNLTDIIKNKLDSYEPDFNPEAWSKLNAQLDRNTPPAPAILKPWLIGVACGILLTIGTFYYMHNTSAKTNTELTRSLLTEVNQLKKELLELKNKQDILSLSTLNKKNYSSQSILPKQGSVGEYQPIVNHQYVFIQPENKIVNSLANNNTEDTQLQALTPISAFTKTHYILLNNSLKHKTEDKPQLKNKHKKYFKFQLPKLNFKQDKYNKFTGPDKIYIGTSIESEGNINGINSLSKSFGIEMSGKISSQMNIFGGINYGINAGNKEQQLWHSEKVFKPDTVYYTNVSDSTKNDQFNWNYIDVPLGFSYKVLSSPKHTFDLSFAAISRIYLKEKYTNSLFIKNMPDEHVIETFKAGEHVHLFAKLKIGFCYSYHLNEKWSILAQPYYNIPLRKHSYFNVKNSSWGLNIKMAYKLNRSNN